ncbi:MAG: aldehyde ferredoxin oxidoreductase, partial [Firmicutes bacterium]|nr:aldehyde ferredoxin oxidoreductase [Bacillota bacterium]
MDYLVRVDMSTGTVAREKVPPQYAGMGGRSLTSSLVYHEVPVGCDPLGKNNKLVMAPGLLGGTVVSSSGRLSVGAKSPLTGRIKEANAGGTAGGYLARSGIRALVIEGEAAAGRRYILYLGKNQDYRLVEVDFEVKGIYELMKRLREKWGDSISVICAGPAGMNKLRSAAVVVSDPHFNPRFAARGGLGAVMGAKG